MITGNLVGRMVKCAPFLLFRLEEGKEKGIVIVSVVVKVLAELCLPYKSGVFEGG